MTDTGRSAQRRRTRKAIVAAAAGLLARGVTPSMAEVAEAADVSRRTVYMYFATLEQLLIDAALLSVTRETVDAALDAVEADQDVERRVEAMVRATHRLSESTEQQGRTLLRLTADPGPVDERSGRPRRGYRRVEWIERALAPLRGQLDADAFERLVSSLAMVVGWEALIVLRDIRALSFAEAEEVAVWAARGLVRAGIEEAARKASARTRPAKRPRR